MSTASITLGDLTMTGDQAFADLTHGFWFKVVAEGTSFGNTDPVIEVIQSLLADGDRVRITRWGNREIPLRVEINGPDLASLAHGEAALRGELAKGNVLTWQAPDLFAAPTAYDVVTSWASQNFDHMSELRQARTFDLTLTCSPFARSVNMVTVPALALGVYAPTIIDTCDSTTGWTATVNGTPSTPILSAGVLTATDPTDPYQVNLRRTGSVNFAATPYLVALASGADRVRAFAFVVGAAAVEFPLVSNRLLSSGFRQIVFNTGGVNTSDITLVSDRDSGAPLIFGITELSRSAMPPQVSPRQISRVIVPGGTERTPASLHVESADGVASLGHVVVHTYPEDGSGFSPDLRRWRVSGNTVTATFDAMSGAYEPIHPNPFRAEVPNSALPAGGYVLAARMATNTPGIHRVAWSTSTVASFGGPNLVGGIEDVEFFVADQWIIVPLALVTLPTIGTTGPSIVTRVDIQRYSGVALINVDEAFLFRAGDDCGLTVVGDTPPHLWLDSPDATSDVPRVWWSETSDRGNMRHPGPALLSMGTHVMHPDGTAVYAGSSASNNPKVSAELYHLWHSNAAD